MTSDFDPFGDPNHISVDKKPRSVGNAGQQPDNSDDTPTVITKNESAENPAGATRVGQRLQTSKIREVPQDTYFLGGPNIIVNSASTLLNLLLSVKNTHAHPDIEGLRNQLITEITKFRNTLELGDSRIARSAIENASYILCAALDDVILNDTSWGSTSVWSQKSLLATIHNDFRGGLQFYDLLDDAIRVPVVNRDILELMYICLSLGFQGKYRRQPHEVESRRKQLFDTLYALRRKEDADQDLSPKWQSEVKKPNSIIHYVPFWVMALTAAALLVSVYSVLLFRLNDLSEPVADDFEKVQIAAPDFMREAPTRKPIPEEDIGVYSRIRTFLAPEIDQNLVEVYQLKEGVLIRLHGDDLFKSASASLSPHYNELLERIASALRIEAGKIWVTGHTDNVPIRTIKFPSNLILSKARANAVAESLKTTTGTPERFIVKGKGAAKPLPDNLNRNAAERARNRRVEIILMAGK